MLNRLWNILQGKNPPAVKGAPEPSPALFTGFLKASNPTIISSDHEFRDPVMGFLDSPPALRQLITHLRENNARNLNPSLSIFSGKRSFIIGLDAQNLGGMNEVLGRDRADRIWSAYMSEFVSTFSKKLSKLSTMAGFRYGGDELVLLVSTEGKTESDVKEALKYTSAELEKKFAAIGLNNIPSTNPERPSGFGLHTATHEIWNDKMFVKEIGSYREGIAGLSEIHHGTKSAHYHGPAVKLETLSASIELWTVVDNLSKNKPVKDSNDAGISTDEFRARYLDKIDAYLASRADIEPAPFLWPENLEMTDSMAGSQKEMKQRHQDFVAQARPNNVLLRFDLSGLKVLNKHLSHVEVEGILERLHETVEHYFMIGSGTHGDEHAYASFDNGSGVIDIMINADVWEERRERGLEYINNFLINTLNFHLLKKSYSEGNIGRSKPGESYEEEQARLLENCTNQNVKQLFAEIQSYFNFAEVKIIDGEPAKTLKNADIAMSEAKSKNKKPSVSLSGEVKRGMHCQI